MEKEALGLLLDIADYLLTEHRDVLERERVSSDQAGPWDERDELLAALESATMYVEQVRGMPTRLGAATQTSG